MTPYSVETVWSTQFEAFSIEVLKVEWEAADVWEYRISHNGQPLTESESEYGSPEAAAAGAFTWIIEEGRAALDSQDAAPEPDQQPTRYTIETSSTGERHMTFKLGGSAISVQIGDDPEEPEQVIKAYTSIAAPVNDYIDWVEADRRDRRRQPDQPDQTGGAAQA